MIPAINESKREDEQQNQIKTTSITYDQNQRLSVFFLKKT